MWDPMWGDTRLYEGIQVAMEELDEQLILNKIHHQDTLPGLQL